MSDQIENKSEKPSRLQRAKPLLRGWSHAGAALSTFPVGLALCLSSLQDIPRFFSLLVFGLCSQSLYTVSALYHIGRWRAAGQRFFHAFDHSNIFLVIAGTYTPICFNTLRGWQRIIVLGSIWSLTLTGIILSIWLGSRLHRSVKLALYVSLGWISLLALPWIVAVLPWQAILVMLLGGLLYTAGGLIYGLRRPNPFPNYFGFHEIFHLFVIAGGLAFSLAICWWILPLPPLS